MLPYLPSSRSSRSGFSANSTLDRWVPIRRWLCLAVIGVMSQFAVEAAAPKVVSVTPANGAVNVLVNSDLVVVFDQEMDTSVSTVPSFPPFSIGNIEVKPDGLFVFGDWSDDGKTLKLTPVSPYPADTTITWTLNPSGSAENSFVNVSKEALATATGSFKTAGSGGVVSPKVTSVTPLNGAGEVSVSSTIVFVFDQAMDVKVPPFPSTTTFKGNFEISPATARFTGAWQPDGQTLVLTPVQALQPNTTITWTLNPAGGLLPFKSASGTPLNMATGFFKTTASGGGGTTNEVCQQENNGYGSYSFSKAFAHRQISATQVVPDTNFPAYVTANVNAPTGNVSVVSASITTPGGQVHGISNLFGFFNLTETRTTEATLEAEFPLGKYSFKFALSGSAENNISMTMPAVPSAIPKIANYDEGQNIDTTKPFTLKWNASGLSGPPGFIFLSLGDQFGNVVFMAPNPCIPRELSPSATSVVIPANTFPKGATIDGFLAFGIGFYTSTNAVPKMFGSGTVERTTFFTLTTAGGTNTNPAIAATFTQVSLLPNGNEEMVLTGSANRVYTIERSGSLTPPVWSTVGTVTMSPTGTATFEDKSTPKVFPVFYRAVAN